MRSRVLVGNRNTPALAIGSSTEGRFGTGNCLLKLVLLCLQYAKGNKGGRPSKYKPEYCEVAQKLCAMGGFTDLQLAK